MATPLQWREECTMPAAFYRIGAVMLQSCGNCCDVR
jgi:hypothetical protein